MRARLTVNVAAVRREGLRGRRPRGRGVEEIMAFLSHVSCACGFGCVCAEAFQGRWMRRRGRESAGGFCLLLAYWPVAGVCWAWVANWWMTAALAGLVRSLVKTRIRVAWSLVAAWRSAVRVSPVWLVWPRCSAIS